MDDKHIKLKDAIDIVRNTVAEGTLEATLELRLLDKSLTADVVEVVRCEDCKHYVPINNGDHGHCGTPLGKEVYGDDFCSDGERAEE